MNRQDVPTVDEELKAQAVLRREGELKRATVNSTTATAGKCPSCTPCTHATQLTCTEGVASSAATDNTTTPDATVDDTDWKEVARILQDELTVLRKKFDAQTEELDVTKEKVRKFGDTWRTLYPESAVPAPGRPSFQSNIASRVTATFEVEQDGALEVTRRYFCDLEQ